MTNPTIHKSNSIKDIIEITKRSTQTNDVVRISELSSLGDIIPIKTAESFRREWLRNEVSIRQLTNKRSFEQWTEVNGFVDACMDVKYVPGDILPIHTEVLVFDDVVAFYRVEPEVSVVIIEDTAVAQQQKAYFDSFWCIANTLSLRADGSTTYAVTIKRSPKDVFAFISDLSNWPLFSDFAADFERVTDEEYIAHTSQGDIRVLAKFDTERMLLDTECILPDGTSDFIPYRVVPNKDGAELMMTNFKPRNATKAEYEEQLEWMNIELKRAKELLEKKAK